MSFYTLLNSTMSVNSVTATKDIYGGTVLSTSSKLSGVPCRIRLLSGTEVLQYEKINIVATHRIYCTVDSLTTAVTNNDTITINTKTYTVQYVNLVDEQTVGIPVHYEIDVKQETR